MNISCKLYTDPSSGKTRKALIVNLACLSALICTSLSQLSVSADSAETLQLESPSVDVVPASVPDATAAEPSKMLVGGVKKKEILGDEQSALFQLAVKKLAAKIPLNAEEYRSLGVGVAGWESTRTFFQPYGKISAVYAGSPADLAGIKKGERIYDEDKDEEAKSDPTVPLTKVTIARVGTISEITVVRHKKKVTFQLVRTNMEDIQDSKTRKMWEQMVEELGFPDHGEFVGTSVTTLRPVAVQQ